MPEQIKADSIRKQIEHHEMMIRELKALLPKENLTIHAPLPEASCTACE